MCVLISWGLLMCRCPWWTLKHCQNDICPGSMACACSRACTYALTCCSSHHCAVWDSSIVVAKFFERWGNRWAGKRCLDLSAGCGLVGAACLFAAGTELHHSHHPSYCIHQSLNQKGDEMRRHLIVVCCVLHHVCTGGMHRKLSMSCGQTCTIYVQRHIQP